MLIIKAVESFSKTTRGNNRLLCTIVITITMHIVHEYKFFLKVSFLSAFIRRKYFYAIPYYTNTQSIDSFEMLSLEERKLSSKNRFLAKL